MPLADDLIAQARQKIIDLQAIPNGQQTARNDYLNLISLAPAGLTFMQRVSVDAMHFATTIEGYRAQLRPWIMVYPAAWGLASVPWATILATWTYQPIPNIAAVPQRVDDMIRSLFNGYVRWITV